jgi:hypothetical protein
MRSLRIIWCSCNQNFRKWVLNPRLYMIVLLLIAFFHMVITPYVHFSELVKVPIGVWLFPHITDNLYVRMMLLLGIVLLFCDAPFIDETQPYVIARAGRQRWLAGQVLYVMIGAAVYFLFAIAASIIYLLPNINFGSGWGKVLSTLAQTDAGSQYNAQVSNTILSTYTPIGAMIWSFLLAWLVGVFLGLLILALNMYFKRSVGVVVATLLVFSTGISYFFGGLLGGVYYFFPTTWVSLSILDATGTQKNPSVLFAVGALLIMSAVLVAVSIYAMRKKEINVLPPV